MFRSSRPTVWVTGTVAALAVLFGAVPAALADSSVLTTGHPDLTAAQAISPKQVLACFDKIVATPFNFTDSNFYLQGYTESRKTGAATGLTISTETPVGGGFCVVVVYTGAGDVRTYSRVVVLAGAVTASVPGGGGSPNVQGSAPLVGAGLPNGPGGTLRPQLAQAAPNGATTVLYTFDEALTAAAGTTAFGFYDSTDTAFHAGTVTGFTPGTGVTVTFGAADAALFSTATRYVVGEGAVTDGAGQTNPVGVVGSATKRLDLAATTGKLAAAGGLTYHFDFSGPIPGSAVACPAAFALYDVSGVRYNPAVASPVTISADRRSVTLTFAAATVGGDTNQITLATVAADAIDAGACGAATPAPLNSEGAAALTSPAGSPGSTSGPDLVSFTINKSTGFASFVFDAPVASPTGVSGFHLVNGSGGLTSPPSQASACLLGMTAESFDVNPSNTVNVNFSSPTCLVLTLLPGPVDVTAARDAVGVTVDEGAVTDATTSELSPITSLGVTTASTPPGPTGPTTPPAPTVPKVTTPTTTTKPVVLSAACKRVVTIHLLTSVSHNLRSATATVNGKKVKIGKSLTVTIPFANYKGSRTIVAKITGKLKSGRTVKTTRRYKSKC